MPERSTVVTPQLLRSMVRDTTLLRLTERSALVVWAVAAVLLVLGLVAAITPSDGGDAVPWLIAAVVFAVLFPPLVLRSTRRALTAALPVGSTVSADVGDRTLHVSTARGSSDAEYSTYRSVVQRGSVVLLRLRGSQIVVALPRELLDEEDLTRLRERIAAAVSAP